MFPTSSSIQRPKCYATHGVLPFGVKPDRQPKSKKPFSTILANPWYHTVDLILPTELISIINEALRRESKVLDYSRVHMKLEEITEGDFFNIYIKTGNIELLSEGSPTLDTQYSLCEGILRLDMPKDTFQRLGLHGRPIPSGGRTNVPSRMRVEINLRLPSMVNGRKGFERIRWAFKNVLNESVTWLFRDCSNHALPESAPKPIDKFHPLERSAHPPTRIDLENVLIPDLTLPPSRDTNPSSYYLRSDSSFDILEWLSLISISSPRIHSKDSIDPYLCRYTAPLRTSSSPSPITILHWHGFLSSSWVNKIAGLCAAIFHGNPEAWFTITGQAMRLEEGRDRVDGWCLLYPPSGERDENGVEEADVNQHEDAEMADAGHVRGGQARLTAGEDIPVVRDPRDFVMWEMVDCVTQR